LTCVGDDWQSIYGFRGSEVAHILNFEKEFPSPEVVPLRVNYRNGGPVVDIANLSIRRCAEYRDKPSIALKLSTEPVILYRARRLNDDGVGYVSEKIRELVEGLGYNPGDILILYRRSASFRLLAEVLREAGLKVRHETIHGAKGLEAPVVFLWALVGGRGGFPSIWEEGRIMRLLLPFQKLHRMDEERRIFYVALTRASERLFLITEQHNASKFLENVSNRYFSAPPPGLEPETGRLDKPWPCPSCKDLLLPEYRFCPFCFHGLEEKN
jgi:superfamily I DNA/RNA helicase